MRGNLEAFIESDKAGRLYDRRVREHLRAESGGEEMAEIEALAALRVAAHGWRIMMDRWLERHDLSEGRLGVLWRLRLKDSMTLGELAAGLDVSARNITGLVDHLEQDGLVERVADGKDRRITRVRCTPSGRQKLTEIKQEMGSSRKEMV